MKLAFVLALIFFWALPARAHETRSVTIEITTLGTDDARVVIVGRNVTLAPPPACQLEGARLHCPGLAGRVLEVDGTFDIAFVRIDGGESSIATPRARQIVLPGTPARASTFLRYLRFGAEHVLSGLDHVLFLIALFWQARASAASGARMSTFAELARTATGFTIGHSLTLGATVLGVLHVPSLLAEACIAWSLVLVALDIRETNSPRARVALATAFGLAHGLGFAGALAETRIPEAARWTALVAFNVGVELGQLLLFVACLALLPFVRRLERPLSTLSAYAVGSLGAAMFFLRTVSLLRG